MSNIDKITANQQLFTELTSEEGAAVSGGATYYLGNKSGIGVNYTLNGSKQYVAPWQENTYSYSQPPVVVFDKKIGPGYEPQVIKLSAGRNNFDRRGSDLILGNGITANRTPR